MTEDHFSPPDTAWNRGAISSSVFFSSDSGIHRPRAITPARLSVFEMSSSGQGHDEQGHQSNSAFHF